jgi:ATPase subunit of ABC transporter with duplicated ATPase domains
MMIGEISPDSGNVKPARDISISYFDQSRSKIKPTSTIQEILCDSGSDYVKLANGKLYKMLWKHLTLQDSNTWNELQNSIRLDIQKNIL